MISKSLWGWIAVILISLSPLIFWALALPFKFRFMNPSATLTSLGQICSLVGLTMYACTLFISARLKWLEDYFGGLNRAYIAHHYFGGVAFILILLHPVLLASAVFPTMDIILPSLDWAKNFGQAALYLTIGLLVVTFYVKLPYHLWKLTHKFLGLAFFFGVIHGIFISSDISRTPALKVYILAITFIALVGYFYRTVLGKFLVPKIPAVVTSVRQLCPDIVEIELTVIDKKLNFSPGQFIFINFHDKNIGREWHPFSLASDPKSGHILVAAKILGDFTQKIIEVAPESGAEIEGPFGRFLYQAAPKNQVWIAGGIGITPFVSMAKSLTPDYSVDLYYSVKDDAEAVYLKDLKDLAAHNVNFNVMLHSSKSAGRLTAEMIKEKSGDLTQKHFFICGPPPMMKSIREQLNKIGIRNGKIHTEEFSLD